ncbi:hypothetical protein GP486_007517 [Trichoglossum hirsutum]|uniref:Uncharacterized protein n=1 Tax=Trichoglossum hirsutum TaxID=265104 RepID=A0A9P8IBL3_9PEZI|nr:hypothetical protein GP486_007517 [Trichoglossum hirsutum]
MHQKLAARLFAASAVLFSAVNGSPVEKRDCNHDNLLRGLLATSIQADASKYCSSYLSIPVVTSTVSTVTPYATLTYPVEVYVTTYITVDTTVTETDYTTSTICETDTNYVTVTSTDYDTVTAYTTTYTTICPHPPPPPPHGWKPREAGPIERRNLFPSGLSSYPPSRISSACSCLSVPTSTTSVTATAPTATVTDYETETETYPVTVTNV